MMRRILIFLPSLLVVAFVVFLVSRRSPAPPRAAVRFAMGHGPTIVLLHGLGSGIQHWLPTARLLARAHRVVLVELPGHDLSPMPQQLTLERAAEQLDAAIAEETKEPVVLVGHAEGGLVAAAEACQHPERVRALVLIETALRPQVLGSQRGAMLDEIERDYRKQLRQSYLAYGRDSAQGAKLFTEVSIMDSFVVKPWMRLDLLADVSLRMRHLLPPLLAVVGEHTWRKDKPWTSVARTLGYSHAPGVIPARIEGCGHFIMLDRPRELARIIERFAANPTREPIAADP